MVQQDWTLHLSGVLCFFLSQWTLQTNTIHGPKPWPYPASYSISWVNSPKCPDFQAASTTTKPRHTNSAARITRQSSEGHLDSTPQGKPIPCLRSTYVHRPFRTPSQLFLPPTLNPCSSPYVRTSFLDQLTLWRNITLITLLLHHHPVFWVAFLLLNYNKNNHICNRLRLNMQNS